ncbi:universal stress protein [Streptomyces sp. WI04-05B]|uniref:universal stress protein n=1 Tax=Streptomyces TaxID=1883 RepID=UPI0029ACDA66|nr:MULTISPECIES: universal stress protein [unclassified Streptomyces]MDX2543178.1 universal stress protein [Streptomyces sp. WI04-05B]MDX2584781.1 universal stress protein [Streptomyces sp. WI04-05A]MDX3752711.1 universal stress protein [Streptomyces sp. AK08-02]
MLRHVTAGIDVSPESLAAAHWAAREATRRGVALCLVHAWEWHPRPAPTVPADMSERAVAEDLPEQVADSVRAAHPGLRVIGQALADSPVSALLKAAEQAELLVLGSRGLGGVTGFLMGSVSQRVVARAPRPVVLVRAGDSTADEHFSAPDGISPDEIPGIPYRDLVLGLDTGRPCDELIEFAFDAAARRGSSLRVINTFGRPPDFAAADRVVPVSGPELRAEQERAVAAALRPWCEKFPEVAVTESVTEGRAADELISASVGAALLVVGRRIRESRLGTHLGPVAHAVLHHAAAPVAVIPHD